MVYLNWICFILICLDVISYIMDNGSNIEKTNDMSNRIAKFIGLCTGVAARVYVLYNTINYWLLA